MIVTLANGKPFDTELGQAPKAPKAPKVNGYVIYEGDSVLDGKPIVVVATMNTSNEKTGNMIQTWILRSDVSPIEAVSTKQDESVCGMCPHRHSLGGGCYVLPFHAPLNVYKAYKAGKYPKADLNAFKGRSIRLGAYGDPAAVPCNVWKELISVTNGHTGYTHQANHPNFDKSIAEFCMISVDTEKQAINAQKRGMKTFRVKTESMKVLDNELECLSDTHKISCIDCGLCDGKSQNIVINVHGKKTKRFTEKFERII